MAIARFPSVVNDCPDPGALATFYGAMLDWKVEHQPGTSFRVFLDPAGHPFCLCVD